MAAWLAPSLILWSAPLTLGYIFAIPFAVETSGPRFTAFLQRTGLCAIPEDLARPPLLAMLEKVSTSAPSSPPQTLEHA
jgi:membrane glycosyltransferase